MDLNKMRDLARRKNKPEVVEEPIRNKPIENPAPRYQEPPRQQEQRYQEPQRGYQDNTHYPEQRGYQEQYDPYVVEATPYEAPQQHRPRQEGYAQTPPGYRGHMDQLDGIDTMPMGELRGQEAQEFIQQAVDNGYPSRPTNMQEPSYGQRMAQEHDAYGRPIYPNVPQQPVHMNQYQEPMPYQRQQPAYVPPEPAFNRSVATYQAPMTAIVTPSKDMINKIIGLPEDLGEFEIVTYNGLSIEPINVKEVRDTTGKLSDIIGNYEETYGLSVVPLNITPILPEVVELQCHEIIELNGVKYASRTDRVSHQVRLQKYMDNIYQTLCTGVVFIDNLWEVKSVDNKEFETIKFNKFELETICGAYRNYSPKVLTNKSGKQLLVIGDRYGLIK